MSREHVMKVILEKIAENLDDVDVDDIDTALSMEEYGATSLDVIEIVSCTMRDLKVKIPRADLADLDTIDAFADAIVHQAEMAGANT